MTDRTGGSGLDAATFIDIDDALEIAEEQASDARVLEHIRRARQHARLTDELACRAYDGEQCPNGAEEIVDGTPLCSHHAAKSDVYDYPRVVSDE